MPFTFSSFLLHTSKLHTRRKKTCSSVTPRCLPCKPWKLRSLCSRLHVLQFRWSFMFLLFRASNFSVNKTNHSWVHAHFYTACTFSILNLKYFIAVLKGWAILFNVCINLYTWLVEAFYWLSINGGHDAARLVLGHCLPSGPPLAIYWVVSTLPWCLVFLFHMPTILFAVVSSRV